MDAGKQRLQRAGEVISKLEVANRSPESEDALTSVLFAAGPRRCGGRVEAPAKVSPVGARLLQRSWAACRQRHCAAGAHHVSKSLGVRPIVLTRSRRMQLFWEDPVNTSRLTHLLNRLAK